MMVMFVLFVVLCVVLFASSFLVADGAIQFLNGVGLLIVLSGTLGATLLSYPWSSFRNAVRVGWNSYFVRPPTSAQIVRNLIEISVHSRFEGIFSLEKYEKQTTVSFLRNGLMGMLLGISVPHLGPVSPKGVSEAAK